MVALLLAGTMLSVAGESKSRSARNESANGANVDAINDAQTVEIVGPDGRGSAVVRAQILLDRAHFSPGQIDGHYGENLRIAILGYQKDRKLNATGTVDAGTWRELNTVAEPALVPYM